MKGLLYRAFAYIFLLAVFASEALARPGGGQMFGGGGGGGGGFSDGLGGGGDAEAIIIYLLIWLIIEHPVIGIPLSIVVGSAYFINRRRKEKQMYSDWDVGGILSDNSSSGYTGPAPLPCRRSNIEKIRDKDPDFSLVLFEDYLYDLYAEAHRMRAKGNLDHFSAYLSPEARQALQHFRGNISSIEGIIIGGMRFVSFNGIEAAASSGELSLQVAFETNYSEITESGGKKTKKTFYSVEHWHLKRSIDARSRTPEQMGVFACPNCGAALTRMDEGICGYCGEKVDTGAFDWMVSSIQIRTRKERPPDIPLHPHGEFDRGLDNPTITGLHAEKKFNEICDRDPGMNKASFDARLKEIFHALQVAWSELDWEKARPFVTDRLFQSQQYWIDAYIKSGMRNVIENPEVTWIDLSQAISDKWYDAVTVRVYAKSLDYTIESSTGRVLGGNRKVRHGYSEYWTLIRGRNSKKAGKPGQCPNCGAALSITTGGNCDYCDAKITSGDFDWVLSRIEQDQTYSC